MPLTVPVLDDRSFDQLLQDATARIPSFTPEWTNYGLDSDPGATIVQLFAFLTDTLLYRVNRYPQTNRLKFLQLLGTGLRPAASATGLVAISNDRGPIAPLPLEASIHVGAGNVDFVTTTPLDVLPVDAQVYYKRKIDSNAEGRGCARRQEAGGDGGEKARTGCRPEGRSGARGAGGRRG
jgi:hypothetical protein